MSELRKLVLVHLLLNVYLVAIVQPMYPILDYLINYDYIVEQLCENRDKPVMACNGKCYLGQQVEKTQKGSQDTDKPVPPQMDLDKITTIRPQPAPFLLKVPELRLERPDNERTGSSGEFLDSVFRPPIS